MRILTTAALAVLLSSGMAWAQSDGDAGGAAGGNASTSGEAGTGQDGSGTDPGNYMTGPNIQRFYTDETMTTMRPEAEMRSTWESMSETERAEAKQACEGNTDNRYNPLCAAIGGM